MFLFAQVLVEIDNSNGKLLAFIQSYNVCHSEKNLLSNLYYLLSFNSPFAAVKVFFIREQMVMGPTPPGTGVM